MNPQHFCPLSPKEIRDKKKMFKRILGTLTNGNVNNSWVLNVLDVNISGHKIKKKMEWNVSARAPVEEGRICWS